MKKIILSVVLFVSLHSFSQMTRDVVYLKNGSIIKGQITEMNPSESIKIQTADGSLFVYQMSEVLKMEKESYAQGSNYRQNSQPVNDLTEQEAKSVIFSVTNNKTIKKNVKIAGVVEWLSPLKKESDTEREIQAKVKLVTFAFGETHVGYPVSKFKFKKIDNEWYLKGGNSGYGGYGYSPYIYWIQDLYMKVPTASGSRATQNAVSHRQAPRHRPAYHSKPVDVTLKPYYVKAKNVPVFGRVGNKFEIKKSDTCNECDATSVARIQNVIYSAVHDSRRYTTSNADVFAKMPNQSVNTFVVNNISYEYVPGEQYNGYYCTLDLTLDESNTYTKPIEQTNKNSISIQLKSTLRVDSGKDVAFDGALQDLRSAITTLISIQNPIAFKVSKMEKDKKGRLKYIYLTKPAFFRQRTVSLFFAEKESVTYDDNVLKIGKELGQLKCKVQSKKEIKCTVRKNMRENLMPYENRLDELVGIKMIPVQ